MLAQRDLFAIILVLITAGVAWLLLRILDSHSWRGPLIIISLAALYAALAVAIVYSI